MNTDKEGANPASHRPLNGFGSRNIADTALHLSDLPEADSTDWLTIARFALTFDGYGWWGSNDACADVANASLSHWTKTGQLPESLTELRTCLFFEQRRWRHFGEQPEPEAMLYITAILAALRRILMTNTFC